jgi:hypothetical protein
MTISVARFKQAFPEFKDTDYDLCSQKLTQATDMVRTDIAGNKAELLVMLQAAHYIAMSPAGEFARLESGETMYARELKTLTRMVTMGVGRTT